MTPKPYSGHIPSNVSRDASYSVVRGEEGEMVVRLVFRLRLREVALLTTGSHRRLVDMVNAVKEQVEGVLGGGFYINEYGHVLVPAGGSCYFADEYHDLLEFDFEGTTISPEPPPDLTPGDHWEGPHVGVAYRLTVDDDLAYELRSGQRVRTLVLSEQVPPDAVARAQALVERLRRLKGGPGRLYINEARALFAPVEDADGWAYLYLGRLEDEDPWFPCPDV
jgi:hypothetical protein